MEFEKKIFSAEREANNLRKEFQTQDARRAQLQDEVRWPKSSGEQTEIITEDQMEEIQE